MQTSLMFVDLKPLGITPDSQKIAIKLPRGNDGVFAESYAEFSDIISALLAATPEQLQHSLENMEKIEVQGEGQGYAPLIDLSAVRQNGLGFMQMLNPDIGSDNLSQSGWTKPVIMDSVNAAEQMPDAGKGRQPVSFDNLLADVKPNAHGEMTSQPSAPSEKTAFDDPIPFQLGRQLANKEIPVELKAAGSDKSLVGNQSQQPISPSDVPATANDEMDLNSTHEALSRRGIKAQTPTRGHERPDIQHSAIQPEEMSSKGARHREPLMARTTSQNLTAVHGNSGQNTGQTLMDHNGSEQGAQQFNQGEARERQTSELTHLNFKPSQWEATVDPTADGQESTNGMRTDPRVDLQPSAARMKAASNIGVENVSGHQEPVTQTSDSQTNVIRQIVQRMTLHTQGMQSSMTVKLKPEFLGNVHMQISTDNQQVVVRMATESLAVKEMVEQGLQYLKTELQHHGLEIDKFDVFVSDDKEESHPGQDLAGFRQALNQRRRNADAQNSETHRDGDNSVTATRDTIGLAESRTSEIDYFA